MTKFIKAALTAGLVLGMTACSSGSDTAAAGGKYTGTSHNGKGGDVTVEVELDGAGKITAVNVTSHSETEGIADPALEQIPAAIVEKQSLSVDSVSGATITSEAIKEAVAEAIKSAGKSADDYK